MTKTIGARLGWIRHGQTEWNRLGKIQGVVDIPLSREGIRQAQLLANRLARDNQHRWHGVVCSDLQRAAKTASIIAERLGIPVVTDARLRERSFGDAEGTTAAERQALWGEDWRSRVPNQESDEQLVARGSSFVNEHVAKHPGESWLIVTHGSFMACLLHHMCPNLDDSHIMNVSLTILEQDVAGWKPLLHNCTKHLDERSASSFS